VQFDDGQGSTDSRERCGEAWGSRNPRGGTTLQRIQSATQRPSRWQERDNRVLAVIPEYVGRLRPRIVFIENVPDLARHRDGRTLREFAARLETPIRGLKYHVEYAIYDAAHFGVPQARRRIVILAVRSGERNRLPEPGPELGPLYASIRHGRALPTELRPFLAALQDIDDRSLTSAAQALSDLPPLGPNEKDIDRPYATTPSTAFQRWARLNAAAIVKDTRTPAVKNETSAPRCRAARRSRCSPRCRARAIRLPPR
jgi:site-specific DNA-cytosine methylase